MKILHTGDWQLSNRGTIAGRLVYEDGINLTLIDRARALKRICDYAQEENVDVTVIPGDIFDHPNPGDIAIRIAVEAVEKLAREAPVIILKGNHDGEKGGEVASALAPFEGMKPLGVFVSEAPEALSLLIKNTKLNIFTLPYPRIAALKLNPEFKPMSPEAKNVYIGRLMEDVLSGFRASIDRNALNLLVGHFGVGGSIYSKGQSVPPFDVWIRKEFLEPFDLVMLGHLHQPQEYYSGTIERNGFDEEEMKVGFKMHTVHHDSVGKPVVSTEFIELPGRQYLTVTPDQFLNGAVLKPEIAIRIKGKADKSKYDLVMRKAKVLSLPFLKNSMEIEMETAGTAQADVSEEPTLEEAIKMWAKGRDGVNNFLDKLILAAKEVEAKMMEAR